VELLEILPKEEAAGEEAPEADGEEPETGGD
jgi:hypothetical protein